MGNSQSKCYKHQQRLEFSHEVTVPIDEIYKQIAALVCNDLEQNGIDIFDGDEKELSHELSDLLMQCTDIKHPDIINIIVTYLEPQIQLKHSIPTIRRRISAILSALDRNKKWYDQTHFIVNDTYIAMDVTMKTIPPKYELTVFGTVLIFSANNDHTRKALTSLTSNKANIKKVNDAVNSKQSLDGPFHFNIFSSKTSKYDIDNNILSLTVPYCGLFVSDVHFTETNDTVCIKCISIDKNTLRLAELVSLIAMKISQMGKYLLSEMQQCGHLNTICIFGKLTINQQVKEMVVPLFGMLHKVQISFIVKSLEENMIQKS